MPKFKQGDKIVPIFPDNWGQFERTVVGYRPNGQLVIDNGSGIASYTDDSVFKLAPVKKEGWINIFRRNSVDDDNTWAHAIYPSKEAARSTGQSQRDYITTIKVEWEE